MEIIIVGAGVAGLASAIALTKWLDEKPRITVLELRPSPSTIGGAVGLTPSAVRCLHHLDVLPIIQKHGYGTEIDSIELFTIYTGAKLGSIDFYGSDGHGVGDPAFKGLRIMRSDLLASLIEAAGSLPNVKLEYGVKAESIAEDASRATITVEDGRTFSADLVVGCDGIHSFIRTKFVDTERRPTYTGIAAVFGFATLPEGSVVPWKDTGLCQSQRGTLMTTHYESTRSKQFVAGIMETEDVVSREGWLARGAEQEAIRNNVKDRFGGSAVAFLDPLIAATEHWTLYPVYKLAPRGKWCSRRMILLGDAAHGMPPQGESTAYALEDAIVFARTAEKHQGEQLSDVFAAYEMARRARIDKAYDEASFGWNTQKDCGWLTFMLRNWMTSVFLWWTAPARQQRYAEDVATKELS